jgi:hypothetical protein
MRNALLIGICACGLGAAADAPYVGTWTMNVAKSDFGESTLTYEQMPGGQIKATMDGQSYTFRTDGTDTPTPWGVTMAWKAVDSNTWHVTEKIGGKETATGAVKLSPDGKLLTMDLKRVKADGGTSNDSMSFQRVSGGPGLSGKWKTRNLNSSSPETMTVTQKGSDGLTLEFGNAGGICDAKFDGKDYTAKGSMWPSGWTCSIAKSGTNGYELTWKKDGKPMYKTTTAVSADGKTLTETGSAVGVNEKVKIVYDRQ